MLKRCPPQKRLDPFAVLRSVLAAQARLGADFETAWALGRRAAVGAAATHSKLDAELVAEALDGAYLSWEGAFRALVYQHRAEDTGRPQSQAPVPRAVGPHREVVTSIQRLVADEIDYYGIPRARRVA